MLSWVPRKIVWDNGPQFVGERLLIFSKDEKLIKYLGTLWASRIKSLKK